MAKDAFAFVAKTGHALDAQRFQMLKDIADELTGEIVFPVNFDLLLHLRKVLHATEQNMEQLLPLLGLEPFISARLIGLANLDASDNWNGPVHDLKGATERLGSKEVRTIALAITGNQLLRSKGMVEFDEFSKRLWDHSLYAASAAYVISKKLTHINPDDAMMAGLIHDLGAFYMLYRATQYDELRIRPDTIKHLISKWHESIGHTLLISLGIPVAIADAIRDHDQPRRLPRLPTNMADVIYVSNLLACEKYEWKCHETDTGAFQSATQENAYRVLIDEIDALEKRLRAPFF